MRKYVIMGVQGSGKGTQAKMLCKGFDLAYISVGDILRWNVQHHTKLGAQVRRIVADGNLVDDLKFFWIAAESNDLVQASNGHIGNRAARSFEGKGDLLWLLADDKATDFLMCLRVEDVNVILSRVDAPDMTVAAYHHEMGIGADRNRFDDLVGSGIDDADRLVSLAADEGKPAVV